MKILTKHFSALVVVLLILGVGLGCNFKSDSEWKNHLHGKKLTMAKTSGSISDKFEFWFCGSGEYAKKTQFIGNSGGFSMADEDFELGKWTVESGTLILQSQNGKNSQYSIAMGMDNNVIKLNGNGYLVESHNECR